MSAEDAAKLLGKMISQSEYSNQTNASDPRVFFVDFCWTCYVCTALNPDPSNSSTATALSVCLFVLRDSTRNSPCKRFNLCSGKLMARTSLRDQWSRHFHACCFGLSSAPGRRGSCRLHAGRSSAAPSCWGTVSGRRGRTVMGDWLVCLIMVWDLR